MNTRLFVGGCVVSMSAALLSGQTARSTPAVKPAASPTAKVQAPDPALVAKERAVVDQYCATCHNAELRQSDLLLDKLDLTHLGDHAEIGEKVLRKLRAGLMPPTGMPHPDAATREALASFIENEIDHSAVTHLPAPGLHRLNRTEYTNAIRDVLALQVDAAKFLPPDDSTRGFDNIAGALTLSPALMEAYLSAAGKISRLAIGDVSAPTQAVFEGSRRIPAQNYPMSRGLPFREPAAAS